MYAPSIGEYDIKYPNNRSYHPFISPLRKVNKEFCTEFKYGTQNNIIERTNS